MRALPAVDRRVDERWRVIRRSWAAAAVTGFPFLFLIDERFDFAFSPVLPGLVLLILVWAVGPYAHLELRRRAMPKDLPRSLTRSAYALGFAFLWFLLWLVFA